MSLVMSDTNHSCRAQWPCMHASINLMRSPVAGCTDKSAGVIAGQGWPGQVRSGLGTVCHELGSPGSSLSLARAQRSCLLDDRKVLANSGSQGVETAVVQGRQTLDACPRRVPCDALPCAALYPIDVLQPQQV